MKLLVCKAFVLMLFLIGAFTPSQASNSELGYQHLLDGPKQDTITEAEFLQWTDNWNRFGQAYSDTSLVKFYAVPIVNFSQVVNSGAVSARCYQGLKPLGNGKFQAKLITVGIDGNGCMIKTYYDVTTPCPPDCGSQNGLCK